jgi:hypothetical protein
MDQNEEGAYTCGSTTLIVEQNVECAHTSDATRKQIVRMVHTPVILPKTSAALVSCRQCCEK